ncbi:MAG: 2-oxoacid:acceptor oxidoreductase family protein [Deltaproteobacteria bacterium]|nr:2-oxoacid:acceptor oxidoreductase family protein [Deltaproteobacteria bacterium]
METVNIVLCGLGGQGILFMTRVLAQAALDKGLNVIGAETHGMAQRGGSVISHLRLGEAESSLVRIGTAHLLLSLDSIEVYRNLPFLSRGGKMYVNADPKEFPSNEVKGLLLKKEITYRALAAVAIAQALGAPRSSNLALLGFFAAFDEEPLYYDELKSTIEKISPERFKARNSMVFEVGYKRGLGYG